MKIEFVASAVGKVAPHHFLTTLIINNTIALDAGALGLLTPLSRQKQIRHVLLSHTHIDHLATLPLFLDNIHDPQQPCVTLHASESVQNCLRRDIFNGRVWPDLVRLSKEGTRLFEFNQLEDERPVTLSDVTFTPVAVDHTVHCFGFLIEMNDTAIGFISDTGPTQRIWDVINASNNLTAVFLEASFPNSFESLAEKSRHLTPTQFAAEIEKLKHNVPLIATHLKPSFHQQVVSELNALALPSLQIAQPGSVYEF